MRSSPAALRLTRRLPAQAAESPASMASWMDWGGKGRKGETSRMGRSQSSGVLANGRLPVLAVGGGTQSLAASSGCVSLPTLKAQQRGGANRRRMEATAADEDDEFKQRAALGAAAKQRRQILEHARRVIDASVPQLEAAEQELNESSAALSECRQAVDACGKLLMDTGYRLENRGHQLAAAWCEQSPDVKRIRAVAAELTRDSDQASRRVMMMQSEMEQAKLQQAEEAKRAAQGPGRASSKSPGPSGSKSLARQLFPETSFMSPTPKGRSCGVNTGGSLEFSEWTPSECLHRRSTTDLLAF
eukprot:gb/GFBE01030032.1/.p1 GENE.gb/GFBE01030032.1/~~gb/GFBE01030032.1/.p1  ORF type:complete len:302 (+),score=63.94 gb/GFBE01030032.1/:1-906(+)